MPELPSERNSVVQPSPDSITEIPLGFCQCGCGKKTWIPKQNHTQDGYIKGQPRRFVRGHHNRLIAVSKRNEPQPLSASYRIIQLTKGYVALVDPDEYQVLSQWNWCASICPSGTVYATRRESIGAGKSQIVLMHRQIMAARKGQMVDHRNGDGLDNRKRNLRFCTKSQNAANQRNILPQNTSGFRGAYWHKRNGYWYAQIKVRGEMFRSLRHATAEEAARAYDTLAREHFGEFARLNFPDAV